MDCLYHLQYRIDRIGEFETNSGGALIENFSHDGSKDWVFSSMTDLLNFVRALETPIALTEQDSADWRILKKPAAESVAWE